MKFYKVLYGETGLRGFKQIASEFLEQKQIASEFWIMKKLCTVLNISDVISAERLGRLVLTHGHERGSGLDLAQGA